ncbi:hypothetical protein AWN76_009895 [Rhodothermaceae bacterium RA]|nr:hypothetical protein AWN76_009895 [Rhodothermaceae bacterium RA]
MPVSEATPHGRPHRPLDDAGLLADAIRHLDGQAFVLDPLDEHRLLGHYALRRAVLERGLFTEADLRRGALAAFGYVFSLKLGPATFLHCFQREEDLIPVLSTLDV